ncbi:hypothetical protein IID26_00055 [Patescibacteria group bacterium]|nr:hypothetical protein [Patescibacteria group bacterium]
MNRIYLVLLAVLFAVVPFTVAAQGVCEVREVSTVVVFGNGINTPEKDAYDLLEVLEKRLEAKLPADKFEGLEFNIAYNRTAGILLDLLEAAKDKYLIDATREIRDFSIAFWRALGYLDILPDWFQEAALESAESLTSASLVNDRDLSNHLALYRSSILEGKTVLLVAHSQGNFFANRAYEILYEGSNPITTQSFGIVSVANPSSFVGGNGPYWTLHEDEVIKSVARWSARFLQPPPLVSNIGNDPNAEHDSLTHGFVTSYLVRGTNSEEKILAGIETSIGMLEIPFPVAEDGIITVTLTWGVEPDVDLHVFEPNGTHVYYANRFGISGFLDVDDVTSFGPEHYFVGCDTLEEGMYRIGVNYFRGFNPEVALVQIQAGFIIRSFETPLETAVGSSGNNSPILVADVIVGINADGVYEFSIMSLGVQ